MGVGVDRGVGDRGGGAPTPTWYHMLDSWRGLACLMIVIHHAGYALLKSDVGDSWLRWSAWYGVRRMSLGVPLFFVISGYCIAASAESSVRRNESPWVFLKKRAWRIYPPYWLALAGFMLILGLLDVAGYSRLFQHGRGVELDAPWSLDGFQWLGNLTLTETWRPHLLGSDRNVYTGVAWSLCFEEQFYFLCFLALCVFPGRMTHFLLGTTAAVAAVRIYAWWVDGLEGLSGSFLLLWHEFAVGLAVYYRLTRAGRPRVNRLIEAGLLALLVTGLAADGRETAAAAAFGLLLIALKRWDTRVHEARWLMPFRESGRRCYAIYLAHLPAGVVGNQLLYEMGVTAFWGRALVMIPAVSVAGVVCGWYFHDAVEAFQKWFPGVTQGFRLGKELSQRRPRMFPQPR